MSRPEPATACTGQADKPALPCFHCGLPVPSGMKLKVIINDKQQPMCCYGCQAVAQAIVDAGHTDFYQHRTELSPTGEALC